MFMILTDFHCPSHDKVCLHYTCCFREILSVFGTNDILKQCARK